MMGTTFLFMEALFRRVEGGSRWLWLIGEKGFTM